MYTNGAMLLITEKTALVTRYCFNAGYVSNILRVVVRYYHFYYQFRKKFYNDIENNNDIDFAILCSLKSGVANKPNDFTLEFICGKPVIFLHKVKDNKKSVLLAYTICKLILKNMQCFDITKEENQIKIKQLVKAYLQNHKKIVSQVNDFNKTMNTMLSKQIDDFKSMLDLINITYQFF